MKKAIITKTEENRVLIKIINDRMRYQEWIEVDSLEIQQEVIEGLKNGK